MTTINTENWKKFRLGDLFTFQRVYQAKSQKLIPTVSPTGDIPCVPYVVQSRLNNMVSRYVDRQWLIDHAEPPVEGNAIVLGVTLNACSYQPEAFGASQVIVARSPYLTEYSGFFVATVIREYVEKFDYKEKPGLKKYRALTIKLPADSEGNPDWTYMEQYMKNVMQSVKQFLSIVS